MAWPTAEENTRLRARQLRRFHEKHISSKGPLKNADKITETDMDLATTLAPDCDLKFCDKDEEEYPKQWETNPRSLGFILSNFRLKAKEITDAINREIDDAIAGNGTFIPPVFPGGYGDREQIRSLQKVNKRLHAVLREEKEKAKKYLARAEEAEAELQRLLEGLEDEDDEEGGDSEEEDEDDDYDEEEENRKRKRRKIDGGDNGVRETIHCSQPGARTRK
ncbi:hypothetical protein FPANT_5802 [Fusarium pseudoanthophilum]|uniref:Uncharacterized protein n=1 Tax=Fusarium pseudoanthophilum TaxID=48495 RepID=A0A8H5P6R5_9HYPO|nr:hypothetical protein FPANT_5802 [Fusarium pseudoanthophilum]